ncbi:MAG: ribosome biogenesis GTPase Der [Betaproteobacteria bacterium HGW-Betaproteobacteria-13]|uniref:GTPase Der n=1 Tax=Parazoarcus communis TaxID=41977 RepID=A0A2U8H1G3_9RHOO|nr:ribosome biogenesis GTPase Der [Parazoarcus communis]AWI79817.1 ribosome biogenesis GTPase Der [Parazoarcus communis]PKO79225.1 MAG: ribosome biogenesis GTPase Der [Betaproteobacteria bacterium HGW-Betaproteobacteria-13]
MKPTIVLVGRPNVGKSTLFNRLTRTRDALVADQPGLTRDRHYGIGRVGDRDYLVVDTAGFDPVAKDGIMHEMARQAEQAIAEADVLLFLVDGRAGRTPHDEQIAARLRRSGRPVHLVVNKAEGLERSLASADFHALGFGAPLPVSAAHGDGIKQLIDLVLAPFPLDDEPQSSEDSGPAVAIVGRPNVGKSTLVNTLIGEERVIAFDLPGTTRDAISIPFERGGKNYTLIDTAGLRRRGRVFEAVEKFSVIKTLQAIQEANVAVLVLDASLDISDQDAHIAGFVLEAGRALVVAINKWDAVDDYQRDQLKQEITRKLGFLSFARFHQISALRSDGVGALLKSVDAAYAAAMSNLSTPQLTRIMQAAIAKQAPPRHGTSRPKLRYAHQGGMNPPIIVIHGNSLENLPTSYVRYLERAFMEAFKLQGTPLRIQFRTAHNPYATKA